jgi:hypothetical protein
VEGLCECGCVMPLNVSTCPNCGRYGLTNRLLQPKQEEAVRVSHRLNEVIQTPGLNRLGAEAESVSKSQSRDEGPLWFYDKASCKYMIHDSMTSEELKLAVKQGLPGPYFLDPEYWKRRSRETQGNRKVVYRLLSAILQ